MHRQGLGWTQETLAEISGLTVRTIQRVENAEPSSVDTRRALARAFKIEDIDAFNKPHAFSSPEKIKNEAEAFQNSHLTLRVTVARAGKELAELAEQMNTHCFQLPDNVSQDVSEGVSYIFDNIRDYGEVDDLYSFSEKIQFHATLDEHLAHLNDAGYSILLHPSKNKCCGQRLGRPDADAPAHWLHLREQEGK